ncbi:MAG TPA: hypothetical protein PLO61_08730 [Fimbriimonadaceae bacterium]|nr:hypothetical protein [Fimbriimonadaceae bacterium]HRJ33621.1 hypothetical protein [Fimbriimonadaceae bacterium]
MPKVISCSQMLVLPEFEENLFSFLDQIRRSIERLPGFRGSTLWRHLDLPEHFMILTQFDDESVADQAWTKLADEEIMDRGITDLQTVPDTRRIRVARQYGVQPNDIELGGLLSMSIRNANSGYGHELMDELDVIFESLHVIPGFKGSCFGPNSKLPEEVFGLAIWSDLRSFQASLPAKSPYEISLFSRIS